MQFPSKSESKSVYQVLPRKGQGDGHTMYIHVSKYKNDKRKKNRTVFI
jgi:hypothetical protein